MERPEPIEELPQVDDGDTVPSSINNPNTVYGYSVDSPCLLCQNPNFRQFITEVISIITLTGPLLVLHQRREYEVMVTNHLRCLIVIFPLLPLDSRILLSHWSTAPLDAS
jgi:hypothetical protein